MSDEEKSCCTKCGFPAIPSHLNQVVLPGATLRLCALCWNDFWDWLAGRSLHTERKPVTPQTKELSVGFCLICRCELDRWLRPLYVPAIPSDAPSAPDSKEAAGPTVPAPGGGIGKGSGSKISGGPASSAPASFERPGMIA